MKNFLFTLVFLFIFSITYSQISSGGTPLSLNKSDLPKNILMVELPSVDTESLLAEDDFLSTKGDYPFRFGSDIPVSYHLNNAGEWHKLADGGRLWRLQIKSQGAHSLNFIIKNFELPAGARLFFINEAGHFLGSFTSLNNNPEKEFATSPLSGDLVTIELYEPLNVIGQSSLEISYVIHAYRNIFGVAKDYGQSGLCNINVNCPQGNDWQNQKRSVALILTSNNTRICSGALVNNVREDGTPYFLTANHCLSGSTSNTWIFMFNYESPGCTNVNGPTNQTVQGSIIRAKDSQSDFALLELTTAPPAGFNVFYSGWNAHDMASDSCVSIHHPSGDIKKITFDYDSVESSGYSGAGNDHWRILSWDAGTTEGGSSGSPLFDKEKRIKGQLHGGSASCSNLTGYDVYGKFSYSWNMGATADKRLKDWLDPDNTGTLILNGADFNTPLYATDATISEIVSPNHNNICHLELSPVVKIRNMGSNTLTSLNINYSLNNNTPSNISWTGNLSYFQSEDIILPLLPLNIGQNQLKIYISNPNNIADENNINDTLEITFNAFLGNEVIMHLTTDNYPEETSWELLDSNGTVIYNSTALSAQSTYAEYFCLENGCYNFVIFDSYGDGMAGGWWPPSPPGTYSIIFLGDTIDSGSGNFGFSDTLYFCVHAAQINKHIAGNKLRVFPNPASGNIHIINEGLVDESLMNIIGLNSQLIMSRKLFQTHETVDISGLAKGIYFIRISDRNSTKFEKLLIY